MRDPLNALGKLKMRLSTRLPLGSPLPENNSLTQDETQEVCLLPVSQ